MKYLVLSLNGQEVLIPVGSFVVCETKNGDANIQTHSGGRWTCDQPYKVVMEMIAEATGGLIYDRGAIK